MGTLLEVYNSTVSALAKLTFPTEIREELAAEKLKTALKYHNGNGVEKNDKVALRQIRKAINLGSTEAQFWLGRSYQEGWNEKNLGKAIECYKQSAKQGCADAQCHLAQMYCDGCGVRQDYNKAVGWFKKAANHGNVDAQYQLGQLYHDGRGVAKDYSKAVKWLQMAAKQGHNSAGSLIKQCASEQLKLGYKYYNGSDGVKRNIHKAVGYFVGAATIGNADAKFEVCKLYLQGKIRKGQFKMRTKWFNESLGRFFKLEGEPKVIVRLGDMYLNGKIVKEDNDKAFKLYKKAAGAGYAEGEYSLGLAYDEGWGVKKNNKTALKYFMKAAMQGHSEAQYYVGYYYGHGCGIKKNIAESVFWYEKSAGQGDEDAIYELESFYHKLDQLPSVSRNKEQKYEDVIELFKKPEDRKGKISSEDLKHLHSCLYYDLGKLYCDGSELVSGKTDKALEWFTRAADLGNVEAQYQLGLLYRDGRGVQQDNNKALEWLEKAASQNHAEACYDLGMFYRDRKEYSKAAEWLEKAENHAEACYNLGMFYRDGLGVEINYGKAATLFEKAWNHGHEKAKYEFGTLYLKGVINRDKYEIKNNKLFEDLYNRIRDDKKDPKAQYLIGLMYRSGLGLWKNYATAVSYFKNAERCVEGQYELGVSYLKGIGINKDINKGVELLRKASSQGYIWAQYELGLLYLNGTGVEKNNREAIRLISNAAEHGHDGAQCELGLLHCEGVVVKKDYDEAIKWLVKAVERGNAEATKNLESLYFDLAKMYRDGVGFEKDQDKATELFEKAAEIGNVEAKRMLGSAYYDLGIKYLNGDGVKENSEEAVKLFEKASHHGYIEAKKFLAGMYLRGQGVEWDEKKAFVLFKEAADYGDLESLMKLGFMYYNGYGVQKDLGQAKAYFSKAEVMGYPGAAEALRMIA